MVNYEVHHMISIDQDVQIVYNEQDAGNLRTSTHNLVFLEDLSTTKQHSDFAIQISDPNGIDQYTSDNNTKNFVNDFFAQQIRPDSFWFVCASVDNTPGILISGAVPKESDFFNALYDSELEEYQSVAYTIEYGQDQIFTCALPGKLIEFYKNKVTDNKILKLQLIGRTITTGINIEKREEEAYANLVYSTVGKGQVDGYINYMVPGDDIDTMGMIICTSPYDDDFAGFKEAIKGDNNNTHVKFKITKNDGDLVEYDIDISEMNSWSQLANGLFSAHGDTVFVYSASDLSCQGEFTLLFKTVERGVEANVTGISAVDDFPIEALIGDRVDLVVPGENIIFAGEDGPNIAAILNATQESPGVQIQEGETINKGDPAIMQKFSQVLSSNNVNPNAVVISRNLNYNLDTSSINVDWTSHYIEGFDTFFGKNVSLVLQTSVYQIFDEQTETIKNPFENWLGDANGRNLIINYSTIMNHYLDGVVAAYMTGIDFDGTNTLRNFKGLDFARILTDNNITDDVAKKLDEYQMNYYAIMSNGMKMYRQGTTYSTKDVKWIDTNTSLNAIIIDMKDALIRLIKNGKIKMNDSGASKIYSSIANVCDKYVNNGFLSATTKTTSIDGQQVSVVVPPYKIDVSRSFTEEALTSRTFPQVNVYLASSSFVNVIKVNLSNMLISEVI